MIEYAVAVRELAEFCHRRGDIDYRFTPSPTGEQGIAGHQQVSRRRGGGYSAEYSLATEVPGDGFTLQVRGRADGYDAAAGMVEEIKTCRVEPGTIPEAISYLHWSQALLYGALVCRQESERGQLDIRLTYFNIDSEREYSRSECLSRDALLAFFDDTLQRYLRWMEGQHRWRDCRDRSIETLEFHHPQFRPGQRDMAEAVYKCVCQAGQLLLQAPTGVGKTAAVLFPSLKALAAGKHERIGFITARTSGRRAAEQTLADMETAGLRLRRLSLTARDSICFSPGKACHGDDCPYASGYYDRLPAAMDAAMQRDRLGRGEIEELAREFTVCPYQLAIDLTPWVDLCVGDSHYVYSFTATLSSLFSGRGQRWSVLLDEAHNLPDRARSMYSAELPKAQLMLARKDATGAVKKALERCNRELLALQKEPWQEADFDSSESVPETLVLALHAFAGAVSEQQAEQPLLLQRQRALLDFFFQVLQFQRVLEVFAADYRFEKYRGEGKQGLVLRLNCLDPGRLLQERQQQAHSVTAFSATVSPPHWVMGELGFGDGAVFRNLPSPFDPAQYRVSVNTRMDTRFRARSRGLQALADAIEDWLRRTPGNCIVYFPAYQYMADVLGLLQGKLPERQILVQRRQQGEADRNALLDALQERTDVVAFCILGGVFGEGIDLPGDALRSVIIVGVGLPQFDRQRQVLRDYYDAKSGQGFEFAYLYPGMQRVGQALGRVIRRESDTGSALLIDSRYAEPAYRGLLPPWWEYVDAE